MVKRWSLLVGVVTYVVIAYSAGILVDVVFRFLDHSIIFSNQLHTLLWGLFRMYTPALAALLSSIISGLRLRKSLLLRLPRPLWGFFAAPLLAFAVIAVAILESMALSHPPLITCPVILSLLMPRYACLALIILQAYLASLTINAFYALGEELGWRGYLQGVLEERLGLLPSSIVVGLVWGYWHAPAFFIVGFRVTIYHAGISETLAASLILFPLFTTGLAIILAIIRKLWGSIFPCAAFHGGINALTGIITATRLTVNEGLYILIVASWIIAVITYSLYKQLHRHR